MTRSANAAIEPANITKFTITSNINGNTADVTGGIVSLQYFESVLDNTIRITATIIDTGNAVGEGSGSSGTKNVLQSLQLSGYEKVEVEFNDNQETPFKLRFTGDKSLYISKIRNIFSHTQKTVFTIDLVTKEYLLNEQESSLVYQRYDGEISSSIVKILQEYLKTGKSIDVDETVNKYNFIGEAKKPFRLCTEVARFGIPSKIPGAKGKVAGYLFFETYDGYKFKSIDVLLDDKNTSYKSFIYNLTTGIPDGYDAKIVEYTADKTIDVQKRMVMGGYGTKLEGFDPYTDKFGYAIVDSENQPQLGGKYMPKLADGFDGPSRKSIRRLDIGHLPDGNTSKEQLKGAFKQNLDAGNVIAQSAMRYNQLFTLTVVVTIPGDLSLRAGDLVHCDFPGTTPKEDPEPDKEISGIYMISDISHLIGPKETYTKMNLVRGSFGRKPK
jgi:hypothetical protein